MPPEWRHALGKLGHNIARGCHLRGLFGCDLIWNPDGQPGLWLTEVNPRYTALTELFELQYCLPLLRWHFAACRSCDASSAVAGTLADELIQLLKTKEKRTLSTVSKGILYAPTDLTTPDLPWESSPGQVAWQIPTIADVPDRGTRIPAGTPGVHAVWGLVTTRGNACFHWQIKFSAARGRFRPEAAPGSEQE